MTDDKKVGAGPVRQPTPLNEPKKAKQKKKKDVFVDAPAAIHGASKSTEDFFYRTGEKARVKLPTEIAEKLRLTAEEQSSSDEMPLERKSSQSSEDDMREGKMGEAERRAKKRAGKQPVKGDDSSSRTSSDEIQNQGPRAGLTTPPNRKLKKKEHSKPWENVARYTVAPIPGVRKAILSKAALSNQSPQLITGQAAPNQFEVCDLSEFDFTEIDASGRAKKNYSRERIESTFHDAKKIEMDMSTTSHVRLNFGDNCPPEIRAEILQRFDNIKKADGVYVYLPELRPSWVKQDWFRHVAVGLLEAPVEAKIKVDGHRAAHSQGMVDAHPDMRAITAAALAMKINGDVEAFGQVFSLAPDVIASDFRSIRAGKAIGTQATRALLKSLFEAIKDSDYTYDGRSASLLQAAANLFATHLGRDDHRAFIVQNKALPQKYEELVGMMQTFDAVRRNRHGTITRRADLERYVNMASMRDGIVYGALLLYNKDLTERNGHHIEVMDAFADAAFTMLSAGASVGSGVGGAAVSAAGGALRTYAKSKASKSAEDLATDIWNSFTYTASLPATTGRRILFLGQVSPENADLANLYATTTETVIKAIASG